MPWSKAGFIRYPASPTWQPFPVVPETLDRLPPGARIIDVGAGGRRITPATVAVDYVALPGTTLRSDAHALGIRTASADCVFSTGVFEHVRDPETALAEIRRILKPGGILHLEVPFIFPFHADPEDYHRWTITGLRALCNRHGFVEVRSGTHLGPASALNVVLIEYVQCYFGSRILRRAAQIVLSILLTPHKYMDYFLVRRPHASALAASVYFVGYRGP